MSHGDWHAQNLGALVWQRQRRVGHEGRHALRIQRRRERSVVHGERAIVCQLLAIRGRVFVSVREGAAGDGEVLPLGGRGAIQGDDDVLGSRMGLDVDVASWLLRRRRSLRHEPALRSPR